MKRLQHMEHGEVSKMSETGRKVDCIFVAEGVEISNIEFKRPNIRGCHSKQKECSPRQMHSRRSLHAQCEGTSGIHG